MTTEPASAGQREQGRRGGKTVSDIAWCAQLRLSSRYCRAQYCGRTRRPPVRHVTRPPLRYVTRPPRAR